MKLTPEQTKRIFALAEKLNISFVDVCQMIVNNGLKELEEKDAKTVSQKQQPKQNNPKLETNGNTTNQ